MLKIENIKFIFHILFPCESRQLAEYEDHGTYLGGGSRVGID